MDTHVPTDDLGVDEKRVRSLLDHFEQLGELGDELKTGLLGLLRVGGQSAGDASHMGANAQHILESVPRIQADIQARSRQLESQLLVDLKTAQTKDQSFWAFFYDLREFANVAQYLPNPVGSRSDPALGDLHRAFEGFKVCIEGLLPLFVLEDLPSESSRKVCVIDDDPSEAGGISGGPSLKRSREGAMGPVRPKLEGTSPVDVGPPGRHHPRPRAREAPTFGQFTAPVIRMARVQEVIAAHRLFGQPISEGEVLVLPGARDQLHREAVRCWQQPLEIFDKHLSEIARDQVRALLERTLDRQKDTEHYRKLSDHVDEVLVRLSADQSKVLTSCYQVESSMTMTLDLVKLKSYEASELVRLQAQRHADKTGSQKAARGDARRIEEELGPGPVRCAISTAACVCGYYRLASARFVDNVCMNFGHNMLKMMQSEFGSGRLEELFPPPLGANAAAVCAHFEAQKATLDGAAKTLAMLVQEHQPKE